MLRLLYKKIFGAQTSLMLAGIFIMGGLGYMGLELLWRKRTHWSMGVAGGLCAILLLPLFAAAPLPFWGAFLCGTVGSSDVE